MRIPALLIISLLVGCSGSSDGDTTPLVDAAADSVSAADSAASDSAESDAAATDSSAPMEDTATSETPTSSDEYVSGKIDGVDINVTKVLVTTFASASLFTFSASEGTPGMAGYKFIRISVTNALGTYDCKSGKAQISYSSHEKGEADARATRGTCSITVTKAMKAKGDAIEATFNAELVPTDGGSVLYRWTEGKLRVVWK